MSFSDQKQRTRLDVTTLTIYFLINKELQERKQ